MELVGMLHDLYAAYPGEDHTFLARVLIEARKNVSPRGGEDAIREETWRLLAKRMKRDGGKTGTLVRHTARS